MSRKRPEWPTILTEVEAARLPEGTLVMFESLDETSYGWAERLSGRWWIGEHAFTHGMLLRDNVLHVVWTPGEVTA